MSEELKTFKVLIVDDVGSVRLSLGNHLKNHHSKIYSNYIVEPHMAKDGFEALEKVENE